MNSVIILNQGKAETYTSGSIYKPYAMISITDFNKPIATFKNDPNRVGLLRLQFDDYESKRDGIAYYDSIKLMDENDAEEIHNFIESNKDSIDHLIVHCLGGKSRSSAIAFAIRVHYLDDQPTRLFGFHDYAPNMLCYKLMMEQFGRGSEVNIDMLREINGKSWESSENLI